MFDIVPLMEDLIYVLFVELFYIESAYCPNNLEELLSLQRLNT